MLNHITQNVSALLSPPKGGWGVIFLLCVLLVACGTKKKAVSEVTTPSEGTETVASPLKHIVETVNANRQNETFATAKINLSLSSGYKSISVGGTLRMKRNDVIQLSLVTFGILEVARIEMTPDYFMGIDKVGKQYVKAAYGDVSFFKNAGIDFYTLQALFWDELFVLGAGKTAPSEKQFKKSMDGERAELTNADSQMAVLSFFVNTASGTIRKTTVSPHTEGASPYLTWEYTDFGSLGKKSFPTWNILTIGGSSKPIRAILSLSNLKNSSDWETRTETPGRSYTEISVDKLMARIMSLTK